MTDKIELPEPIAYASTYERDSAPDRFRYLQSDFYTEPVYSLQQVREVIAADRAKLDWPPLEKALAQERHEFKNFHRQLCKRFDYCHDEVDWKRDQVSLIEHIADRAQGESLTDEQIGRIGFDCGLKVLTTMLDDDQWANIEPRLFKFARALLADASLQQADTNLRLANAPQVPEGFALVPVDPTDDMIFAFSDGIASRSWRDSYKAMLSAAPQPEQKGQHERD